MFNSLFRQTKIAIFILLFCTCLDSPVLFAQENQIILKNNAGLILGVAPESGGRITRFNFKENEFLKQHCDSTYLNCGSTLWISPQSIWN